MFVDGMSGDVGFILLYVVMMAALVLAFWTLPE